MHIPAQGDTIIWTQSSGGGLGEQDRRRIWVDGPDLKDSYVLPHAPPQHQSASENAIYECN